MTKGQLYLLTFCLLLQQTMVSHEIDAAIAVYHRLGYSQSEIVNSLLANHDKIISERHLRRHLTRLGLFRRRQHSNVAEVALYILKELELYGQLLGYRMMHMKCLQAGFVVSRETVRRLLNLLDPEGVSLRSKKCIVRRRYLSKGPNFVWHLDSYDKLKPYGICINGCIDGFSRNIIWLQAYRTSSDPKVIAGYFMEAVCAKEGCPMRLRGDMGTENYIVADLQRFMRRDGTDRWV